MNLEKEYQSLRTEAEKLAGKPGDIRQRAVFLHEIFEDSKKNHCFAEIAMHGALWAYNFFETTGTLGKLISYRYFYDREEMKYRHGLLQGFSEGFKAANRSVFIDTYSNYYFTKQYGKNSDSIGIMKPELLNALETIHQASKSEETLDTDKRRELFNTTLLWEQETTVAPAVKTEVAKFDCPILKRLVLKPFVRFSYFPKTKLFWFKNFSETDERIARAHECFEVAEEVGWKKVFQSMQKYEVLDKNFFRNPLQFTGKLKSEILAAS
jgi:hypothetical protein